MFVCGHVSTGNLNFTLLGNTLMICVCVGFCVSLSWHGSVAIAVVCDLVSILRPVAFVAMVVALKTSRETICICHRLEVNLGDVNCFPIADPFAPPFINLPC